MTSGANAAEQIGHRVRLLSLHSMIIALLPRSSLWPLKREFPGLATYKKKQCVRKRSETIARKWAG